MFKNLVGNEDIKLTLRRLIAKGRVPNSLLLAGDEGVGKRQFALELARSFLCLEPTDGESCGTCAPCRRADTFTFPKEDDKDAHERVIFSDHPDVGTIVPYKRNILVKAIRHLESEANYRPYEARARFFVVDDAEKMNDAASNALLKTLEEPPATTHLFLITSRPDSLLPTIRSRCQTIRFAPVNKDDIERYLVSERAFTHDEAKLAAKLSRGSVGRADSINVEKFKTAREKMLSVVFNAIETRDLVALLRIAEEMNDAKHKEQFEENLATLQSLIHDVWTLRTGGDFERVVNTDLCPELARLAEISVGIDLHRWLAAVDEVRENLIVNINRKIAADSLFVSMASR